MLSTISAKDRKPIKYVIYSLITCSIFTYKLVIT